MNVCAESEYSQSDVQMLSSNKSKKNLYKNCDLRHQHVVHEHFKIRENFSFITFCCRISPFIQRLYLIINYLFIKMQENLTNMCEKHF